MTNLIIAISLANLCFFRILAWQHSYFVAPPFGINLIGWMLDVLLFALLMWTGFLLAKKYGGKHGMFAVRLGFLFFTVIAIRNLYRHFVGVLSLPMLSALVGKALAILITILVAVLIILVISREFQNVIRAARAFVIVLSPFALILFSQTIWLTIQTDLRPSVEKSPIEKPARSPKLSKRIVLIIFDELDYSLTFDNRPHSLKIPELQRFADESFSATNAYPPSGNTDSSIPALTTGRLVEETREKSQNELQIRFADANEFTSWKTAGIFSKINDMGGTNAVVGWHHPYCRVFRDILERCTTDYSFSLRRLSGNHEDTLLESMVNYFRRFGLTLPIIKHLVSTYFDFTSKHVAYIKTTKNVSAEAKKLSVDKDLSFALLHYPVPHSPYIYSRENGRFVETGGANYFDNLALTDALLGELRTEMENADIWEKTIVVVTSDHWWRGDFSDKAGLWTKEELADISAAKNFRVPFIIKPFEEPGEATAPIIYDKEFNTVLVHDLLLAMLSDQIASKKDIALWLDEHRSIGKSPY